MLSSYSFRTGLCLLLCLLMRPVFSQSTFQKFYTTQDSLLVNAQSVLATSDGYVVAGLFLSSISDNVDNYVPMLMKINPAGSVVWLKKLEDGLDHTEFSKVIAANDGGYLAIGRYGFPGVTLIVKTDADGNLQWKKVISSASTFRGNSASSVIAVPGGYVISGFSRKNSAQSTLTRINNQGETLWSKRYINDFSENIFSRAELVSGDTIFASGFRDNSATFSLYDATTGNVIANTLFKNPIAGNNSLLFMAPAANGDFVLGGYIAPPPNQPGIKTKLWVCRISRTGAVKWSKTYNNIGSLTEVVAMSGNNFLLVSSISQPQIVSSDPILTKIDGEGDVIWSYNYGNAEYDIFESAVEDLDGSIVAVGGIRSVVNSNLPTQILIVKTDASGLVSGCCRQPVNAVAENTLFLQSPETLNTIEFDTTEDTFIGPYDAMLVSTDYCPTPAALQNIDVMLCPGDSIVIDSITYKESGTVTIVVAETNCTTTIVYNIQVGISPMLEKTASLCPGDSITIDGMTFSQAGTFTHTIPSLTGGCDTLVTYDIQAGNIPTLEKTATLCPGDSITINGSTFSQAGTFTQTILSLTGGCDTLVTYNIQVGTNPTLEKDVFFCPGDTVTIGGITFTQPATFVQMIPATTGCDTLLTYHLQYSIPVEPTNLSITCPTDISVQAAAGALAVPVMFDIPTVQGDCICPGDRLEQTQGLSSGSAFPIGSHTICFKAEDNCGKQASCCFQVNILEENDPCDVKVNGCLRFELLRITHDAQSRRTYHIRVQNNCAQSLTYAAFQLPTGVIAYAPQNNATYSGSNGQAYTVRNPNNAPTHSIRFSAQGTGIQNGESDVFEYTLPPYSEPDYIHALVKLNGLAALEVHLNTFNCPVEPDASNRSETITLSAESITIFPNPAEDVLVVDLSAWSAASTQIRVFNVQGQVVLTQETAPTNTLVLPLHLLAGIYVLEASAQDGGQRAVKRFVVR